MLDLEFKAFPNGQVERYYWAGMSLCGCHRLRVTDLTGIESKPRGVCKTSHYHLRYNTEALYIVQLDYLKVK